MTPTRRVSKCLWHRGHTPQRREEAEVSGGDGLLLRQVVVEQPDHVGGRVDLDRAHSAGAPQHEQRIAVLAVWRELHQGVAALDPYGDQVLGLRVRHVGLDGLPLALADRGHVDDAPARGLEPDVHHIRLAALDGKVQLQVFGDLGLQQDGAGEATYAEPRALVLGALCNRWKHSSPLTWVVVFTTTASFIGDIILWDIDYCKYEVCWKAPQFSLATEPRSYAVSCVFALIFTVRETCQDIRQVLQRPSWAHSGSHLPETLFQPFARLATENHSLGHD